MINTTFEQSIFSINHYQGPKIFNDLFETEEHKGIFYKIRSRRKNNSKKTSIDNNESLLIIFDYHLSKDLNFVYGDEKGHLTISLIEADQPTFLKTKLTCLIEYVNEKQELITNPHFFYVDTIPGRLTKRLELYRDSFKKECEEIVQKYKEKGFQLQQSVITANLINWIRQNLEPGSCSWHQNAGVNRILIIYSILNDDILYFEGIKSIHTVYASNFNLICDMTKDVVQSITREQEEQLRAIYSFVSSYKAEHIFIEVEDGYKQGVEYKTVKERFLKNYELKY